MTAGPLDQLIGQELDTVSFVRDYVELRIDYSILRALTSPTGIVGGMRWQLSEDGSADLLRKYIGKTVSAAELVEGERISIVFDSGDRIDVSLRPNDRVGPEAAHFVPAGADGSLDTASMWVW